jgi:predicted metal-dependent peptidase
VTPERNEPFAALEEAVSRQANQEAAARALNAARARLILGRDAKSAFFATLVLRLESSPAWDVETIATDGRVLQYNPEFVMALSAAELAGVLCHEVMHCALAHPARRGARDSMLWNIACDLAINPLLLDAGVALPLGRLVPGAGKFTELPAGKSAEEYYAALMRGEDDQSDGDGSGTGAASADPGGCGQVIDSAPGDPAATQANEAEWKVAVVQAQQAAAGRGKLPAGLGRAVDHAVHPPADWRCVLREFVACHAKNDYSWSRPNRRFLAQGLYLPGLHSEELGDVVLAVDTSGSIDQKMLSLFAVEVNAVLAAYDCSVTVLYHDTEIQRVQIWNSADGPLVLDPIGGGGTSHTCVFDWIDQAGIDPACVVCLTDLETEFPVSIPTTSVLWAVPGQVTMKPPFGQVVPLSS